VAVLACSASRAHAPQSGQNLGGGDAFGPGERGGAVGLGQVLELGHALGQGGDEDVFGRLGREQAVEAAEGGFEDEIRRHDAACGPGAGLGDAALQQRGDLGEAGEVVVRIAGVADGVGLGEEIDQHDLQASELVEHVERTIRLGEADRLAEAPVEDFAGGALGVGQLRLRPFLQLGQAALSGGGAGGAGGGVDEVKAVGAIEFSINLCLLGSGQVLGAGGGHRVGAHPVLGDVFDPGVELGQGMGERRAGDAGREGQREEEAGWDFHKRIQRGENTGWPTVVEMGGDHCCAPAQTHSKTGLMIRVNST
jgi:hypothetical protein